MGKYCHDPLQRHKSVHRNVKDLRPLTEDLLKKLLQPDRNLNPNTILCRSCRKMLMNNPTLLLEIQIEATLENSSSGSSCSALEEKSVRYIQ